jgi:hypothetical protein
MLIVQEARKPPRENYHPITVKHDRFDAHSSQISQIYTLFMLESAFSAFIYVLVIIDNHRRLGRCA